jgi:hypothetical protein
LEEAYYSAVGMELPPLPESQKHHPEDPQFEANRGMQIPYEVKYDPAFGRVVYTTTFVPKGTLVWSASHTAGFTLDTKEKTSRNFYSPSKYHPIASSWNISSIIIPRGRASISM